MTTIKHISSLYEFLETIYDPSMRSSNYFLSFFCNENHKFDSMTAYHSMLLVLLKMRKSFRAAVSW